MKNIFIFFIVLFSAFARSITLPTAQGDVEIAKEPQRIAVYDLGVLNTLLALGLNEKIVGVPDFGILDKNAIPNAKEVGTLFEPDIEALSSVRPDLIIVAARSASKLKDVGAIAQAVDLSLKKEEDNGYKDTYKKGLQRMNDLAILFGKTDEAQKITDELRALSEEVKVLWANQGKVLALLVSGPKVSLYGASSRVGWIQEELGINLVEGAENAGPHGESVSFEFIADANPDWIYALDRLSVIGKEGASAKETLDNELVKGTKAWKEGHIIYPNAYFVYLDIGSPTAFRNVLEELKAVFSKEK